MGIDPDNGWTADWQIIPEKEKVIKSLRKAAKGVEHIYLATDLDREGEAIAWHLKEALGPEKYNYSRVRFNQITKSAIIDSFADPKEIDLDLVKAYRARIIIFFWAQGFFKMPGNRLTCSIKIGC